MNKSVYIVGSGGHVRSLCNIIDPKKYEILGILDNTYKEGMTEIIAGIKIIDSIEKIIQYKYLILALGDNNKRAKTFAIANNNILLDNLIHYKACVESHVEIGNANQIFANTYINSYSKIGDNNIINTGSIIEHENHIGNHNHISIGAILGGRVKIGDNCFIGAGSTIIDKITICNNVTIGANAVVIKDIKEPGVYVGNPVKKIK